MATSSNLLRKTHFLGAKIRSLRKRNGLTLEDVSVRCIQVDPDAAPSVSYLSMIETGRRIPSEQVLGLLAGVFQKEVQWFMDENLRPEPPARKATAGGIEGIPLEPGFLFSKDLLQTAIPELLSQTGTTGRQFAHLLIRSYQEMHQNRFADLERAAEEVGAKQFPLGVEDMLSLCGRHGLAIRWFDRRPFHTRDDSGHEFKTLVRSLYEPPGTVHVHRRLESEPARLKYDLACHLGHKVLHDGDGRITSHATGGELGGSPQSRAPSAVGIDPEDILFAWRHFECSFFAGALLCPKAPFRRFLTREAYDVDAGQKIQLTPAVVMRRMTAVSPYRHWHYFDAYPPGYLRAVYRGNGIPLPWGNMRMVTDPCRQWAVFRMLSRTHSHKPFSQISVLQDQDKARLYCCWSLRTRDAAGNSHVLCVGVDLLPALEGQGVDAMAVTESIARECHLGGGAALVPEEAREQISMVSKVLNIRWIAEGLKAPAGIICPRSTACPRSQPCTRGPELRRVPGLHEIRDQIVRKARRGQ